MKENLLINLFNCCNRVADILTDKKVWAIQEHNIICDCCCITEDMLPMRIHVLATKKKNVDYSNMNLKELYATLNRFCSSFLEKNYLFQTEEEKKLLSDIRDLKADLSSQIPEPLIIPVKKNTFDLILSGKAKGLRIKITPYWEERFKRIGVYMSAHSAELGIYKDDSVIPVNFQNGQNEICINTFITEDIENYEVNGTRYYILHFANIQKGAII